MQLHELLEFIDLSLVASKPSAKPKRFTDKVQRSVVLYIFSICYLLAEPRKKSGSMPDICAM